MKKIRKGVGCACLAALVMGLAGILWIREIRCL